jgi:hypothetical protein
MYYVAGRIHVPMQLRHFLGNGFISSAQIPQGKDFIRSAVPAAPVIALELVWV